MMEKMCCGEIIVEHWVSCVLQQNGLGIRAPFYFYEKVDLIETNPIGVEPVM